MGYKKADDVLPDNLVAQIQEYIDGESIYIPRKKNERRNWGEQTQIREELSCRNRHIMEDYISGLSISDLAKKYFLSEKSIQRIVYSFKQD